MGSRGELAKEIADCRRSLVDTLAALPDDAWETDSLCTEWTIREVVAHLVRVDDYYRHPSLFAYGLIRTGLRLGTFLARDAQRRAAGVGSTQLLAALVGAKYEERLIWRLHPWPAMALGEFVIHGQDIRRPLEVPGGPTERQLRIVADLLMRPVRLDPLRFPWGAPPRPRVRFEATDATWSAGHGPIVKGPLEAIVMVLAGRMQAVSDLAGDGLERLR